MEVGEAIGVTASKVMEVTVGCDGMDEAKKSDR